MGVVGTLSGVYGADGLGLRMRNPVCLYLSLKYAVYSGNLWSECVELEGELFVVDDGE